MKTFGQLRYNRPLRDYQQRVLNRFATYASNGKVNIVAAPGSGKTVLGLEMICRLGRAALVLSPSVTVRQQWGQRFAEGFLPEDEDANDYISHSLRTPKPVTSTTCQALHAAWTRGISRESSEDESDGAPAEPEDFSDFDILTAIKEAGIGTICLDEAHHLRAEWHRALEAFIRALDGQVIIISLTATPPYDSTAAEWKRYIDLCGEIDEEIYVPELVKQGSSARTRTISTSATPPQANGSSCDATAGRRQKLSLTFAPQASCLRCSISSSRGMPKPSTRSSTPTRRRCGRSFAWQSSWEGMSTMRGVVPWRRTDGWAGTPSTMQNTDSSLCLTVPTSSDRRQQASSNTSSHGMACSDTVG